MDARWYSIEGNSAKCRLCFRGCVVPEGGAGYCGARRFVSGKEGGGAFVSPYLGRFSSIAVDPIEKKPLHYWRPGSFIFSLGGLGCNMRCPFCQNHAIAQPSNMDMPLTKIAPGELVRQVKRLGLASVAYTYNEPALQAEYILEAAPLLKDAGAASVLVTNGMFSQEVLGELTPWIDAANIDIKTFDPEKYSAMGGSLTAALRSAEAMISAGVHVELTALIVPGISDSPEDFARMADWIADVSADTPLHISRYFPACRYSAPPTDIALMLEFERTAKRKLNRVRLGNM